MTFSDGQSRHARPKRILLVEDSDTVRVLTAEYLRSCGHDVIDVESAEQALGIIEQTAFDILFTDLSLPGMSGIDLAREVCERYAGISLILSSGFDDEPDTHGLKTGVQFLAKPYDLVALDRALACADAANH